MKLLSFITTVFAEGEGTASTAVDNSQNGIPIGSLFANPTIGFVLYMVVIVAVFYFLLIRPQRKRDKEMRKMLEALAIGDKIVTIGGIYGKITKLKEDTIEIESGSGTNKSTIKLARSSVKEVLTIKE